MSGDEIPRGSKFICAEFDPTIIPKHPKTGEPIPPPFSCTFSCAPEAIGWTRARLAKLISSTGWKADIFEQFIYREDEQEPASSDDGT